MPKHGDKYNDAKEQALQEKAAADLQIAQDAINAARPNIVKIAKRDYSHIFYYSQKLRETLYLERPSEQLGFFASTFVSSIYAFRSVFRAYHLIKAAKAIDNSEAQSLHMAYAKISTHFEAKE